ncbi:hypothetical protein ACHHZ9_07905 [Enterobacter cloacae complex sp. 2024EL-00232]|uniref:hypothetical protein n=1 Tax=unclassified Enterobacter cloacae complex TaxID=2757714 RepID=UPI001E28F37F|nr:hypothetical protein [Enterobacter cloacae complex sp. 2021EL-01261]MCD2457964.1 hypothetical protein [Enterobacter cloacae complex sp. 2021EL-01261]
MDITPKHVGIASGLMNAGSAVAGIISPILFGVIIDRTGNWSLPPLLVARNKVGIMGGAMNMAGSIGGISVPIVVGLLLQASGGYQAVLWFFAGCSLVYMVGSFCISLQPRVGGKACITAQ